MDILKFVGLAGLIFMMYFFGFKLCRIIDAPHARSRRSKELYDGRIIVNTTDPEKDVFRLEYDGNLGDIYNKNQIVLKVVREERKASS